MTSAIRLEAEHPHDPSHDVLVISDWLSYEVESDLFTAADAFTLRVRPSGEYLSFFREPGHLVRLFYKNNLIMTGHIEAAPVNTSTNGPQIELTGRDFGALLMDDAAPLLDLGNQSLRTILELLVGPHAVDISQIVTSNDANRFGLVGKHADYSAVRAARATKKTTAGQCRPRQTKAEKAAFQAKINALARTARAKARRNSIKLYAPYNSDPLFKAQTKIGDTRWTVLDRIAKHIGVSIWMTAEGHLCVSRPDYKQPPIGKLFTRIDSAGNVTDSNCTMSYSPDLGNRASEYLCFGQGRPRAKASGKDLSAFKARAQDPSRAFWWDSLMTRKQRVKTLQVQNTSSKKHLTRYVRTKMEEAAAKGTNCIATVEGHEVYPGGPLWAVDTMTDVEYQPKDINAPMMVRRRQFKDDNSTGETTDLTLIPPLWLALDHDQYSDSAYFAKTRELWRKYGL